MGNLKLGLKDERRVTEALIKSLTRTQTAAQILEQRVSLVVGSLGPKSNVTREQVRKELARHEGAV